MTSLDFKSILICCTKTLSAHDFFQLHTLIGTTKYKTSVFLSKPWTMTKEIVVNLAKVLNTSPLELIDTFGCGLDGITTREYKELLKEYS